MRDDSGPSRTIRSTRSCVHVLILVSASCPFACLCVLSVCLCVSVCVCVCVCVCGFLVGVLYLKEVLGDSRASKIDVRFLRRLQRRFGSCSLCYHLRLHYI